MSNSNGNHPQPAVLDLKQSAQYSGFSYWYLYDAAKAGLIATVRQPDPHKPGRFLRRILFARSTLDAFIQQHETTTATKVKHG